MLRFLELKQKCKWFLFQAPCSADNFIEGFLEDAYGDGLKNKKV